MHKYIKTLHYSVKLTMMASKLFANK